MNVQHVLFYFLFLYFYIYIVFLLLILLYAIISRTINCRKNTEKFWRYFCVKSGIFSIRLAKNWLWIKSLLESCNIFQVSTSYYMVKISEKILIYKIRTKKDAEAFALLYDEYIEKIYRFIFFKISHKQEAEDLTSEVFLKTWNYLTEDQAAPVRTFGGLIYSIARNSVIDWYRKRAKASEYELAEEIADVAGVDMAEKININQETEQLLKLVKTLKQDYQEIILLKFIEGLSVSEIARILGKKNIAVRVTIHRAIKKLKELNGK